MNKFYRNGVWKKTGICTVMMALYAIQFIAFPKMFPKYFRITNEAVALYWLSFAVIAFLGGILISARIGDWIPGNIIYLICVKIYSADRAYNFDLRVTSGIEWLILKIIINFLELLLFQLLILGIIHLVRIIRNYWSSTR